MKALPSHKLSRLLRRTSRACAVVAVLLGALAIVGWTLDNESLRGISPVSTPMNPVTALALLLAGVALWLIEDDQAAGWRRHAARIMAVVVAAVGLAKLTSYALDVPLNFDQLLFAKRVAALHNQIAPNTALNISLIGTALALLDVSIRRRHWPSEWLALAAGLISLLALVGYAYGVEPLQGIGLFLPMALNTALGCAALSVGILCARPNRGLITAITSEHSGGRMARQLLPAAIFIPVFLGWLGLKGEAAEMYDKVLGTALLVLLTVIILATLLWHTATWLNRNDEEHLRIERILEEERHLLQTLMDNLPDHIYFKDRQSRFLRISRSHTVKFGLSDPRQAVGKTDRDFFTEEHAQQALADERRLIHAGEPIITKVEKETWPDGRTTWVSTSKLPLRSKDGRIIGTFGISHDVTASKQAEQLMARQSLEARLIYRATALAAQTDRLEDALQGCVDIVCELTGWPVGHVYVPSEDEADLLEPTSIWHLDDPQRFAPFRAATQRTRIPRGVGLPGRIWDTGEPAWISDLRSDDNFPRAGACDPLGLTGGFGFPIKIQRETVAILEFFTTEGSDPDDNLLMVVRSVGEQLGRVIERQRAQEALREAKEAAEAANRAKSSFLANMSHEIRTPLNAVLGMTELVLGTRLNVEQRQYLNLVCEAGESLLGVINDVLDFSKIEAGKLELDPIPFNLRDRLGDAMRSLAFRAHSKRLELACRVQPDVPDRLIADPLRLRQVVVNLVGNAIKFTEKGEVVVQVGCDGVAGDQMTLRCSVNDTGIGIAPEKQTAVFEAFEQADSSTTRRFGGTGLGLAISTALVELMGGRIWLESELGRGSTFHFTVPVMLAPPDFSQPALTPATSLREMRILVVDDNATNRMILEEILSNWEMRPSVATGADVALRMMREAASIADPYLVVLTDCNMPDADGFALSECIKQEPQLASAVILMISSSDSPGDINRCEQAGISAYLMKPVKQSELFDAIVAALRITPEEEPHADMPSTRRRRVAPLRILLVEDSIVNQKLAVALLERAGHTVAVADNGRTAVDRLAAESFDAVLMDIQMPVMDGLEATAAIRAREKQTGGHVPIVAMTAHAMKGDREQCLAAGMDGYVAKPIRTDELLAALEQFAVEIETASTEEPLADPSPLSDASGHSSGPLLAASSATSASHLLDLHASGHASDVATQPNPLPFDSAHVLRQVRGDRVLLAELAAAFHTESQTLMTQLREAIDANDASKLRRAAHTLKGAAGVFGARAACETAKQLEALGGSGELSPAARLFAVLETQIEQLNRALG